MGTREHAAVPAAGRAWVFRRFLLPAPLVSVAAWVKWRAQVSPRAEVELSSREFGVLQALLEVRPRVLSRQQLEATLYNFEQTLGSNAIEVHVHHLRRKLGEALIRTVRGVGYFIPAEP